MNRSGLTSSLRKSYSNEPKRTLSFVEVDDSSDQEKSISEPSTHVDKHKSKTEKSVHFADEESIADDNSSLTNGEQILSEGSEDGGISWLPSEHLYSDDTFIQETETTGKEYPSHDPTTTIGTVPSYGSSTFVSLHSSEEDNTDTEQLYSYTDSFVSSDVFTTQSGTTTYKSWRDVTEIVKDIEELEESEFVTRADSLEFDQREGEETEASESLDEEMIEAARLEFVAFALRTLRLKELQSPRSLAIDSFTSGPSIQESQQRWSEPQSKEEKRFCQRMIQKCKKNSEKESSQKAKKSASKSKTKCVHPLYQEVERKKDHSLEFYGLNSALVERLRLRNLQTAMEKRACDLDRDISNSTKFVKNVTENVEMARDQFVSQMCSRVRRENMDDAIQAHLIKMHPVTKFAEFVKDLPSAGEDAREILYKYKRQLEQRMANGVT